MRNYFASALIASVACAQQVIVSDSDYDGANFLQAAAETGFFEQELQNYTAQGYITKGWTGKLATYTNDVAGLKTTIDPPFIDIYNRETIFMNMPDYWIKQKDPTNLEGYAATPYKGFASFDNDAQLFELEGYVLQTPTQSGNFMGLGPYADQTEPEFSVIHQAFKKGYITAEEYSIRRDGNKLLLRIGAQVPTDTPTTETDSKLVPTHFLHYGEWRTSFQFEINSIRLGGWANYHLQNKINEDSKPDEGAGTLILDWNQDIDTNCQFFEELSQTKGDGEILVPDKTYNNLVDVLDTYTDPNMEYKTFFERPCADDSQKDLDEDGKVVDRMMHFTMEQDGYYDLVLSVPFSYFSGNNETTGNCEIQNFKGGLQQDYIWFGSTLSKMVNQTFFPATADPRIGFSVYTGNGAIEGVTLNLRTDFGMPGLETTLALIAAGLSLFAF